MRIQNAGGLTDHGNQALRALAIQIMEAGLQAADPYNNTKKLIRREGYRLYVGGALFEAAGDPRSGEAMYDLGQIENVYVVGAGKGVARVAQAIEEVLGDRVTGGCVVAKRGDPTSLARIRVAYGAHPVPDEGCVRGCGAIVELARRVTARDLVFTVIGNGGSSLLTLPEDGVSLDDVKRLTRMMQIERGVTTIQLNKVRNHVDKLKGGKLARLFSAAQCVHLIVTDANHHVIQQPPHDYRGLMEHNVWLHNLPEGSTFEDAVQVLKGHGAWDDCPASIREFLTRADQASETVKAREFAGWNFRVFGVMPDSEHFLPVMRRAAQALGFRAHVLTQVMQAEARECARVLAAIAKNVAAYREPFAPPVALLASGEMLVTCRGESGVGGRNQEFALAAALEIAGQDRIVIGSADSDGTDGPGGLDLPGAPNCLGGGLVDGATCARAQALGLDIGAHLRRHATSEPLWRLGDGMHIAQNISLNDLTLILIR